MSNLLAVLAIGTTSVALTAMTLAQIPFHLYLKLTPFGVANFPYACWELVNRGGAVHASINPCHPMTPDQLEMAVANPWTINIIMILIAGMVIYLTFKDNIKDIFSQWAKPST